MKQAMSKQGVSLTLITCARCGTQVMKRKAGKATPRYCGHRCGSSKPLVRKPCHWCGETFVMKSHRTVNARRRFCSTRCAALWRTHQPGYVSGATGKRWTMPASQREATRRRMRTHNPMQQAGSRAKMQQALRGRTFLARGGKPRVTEPQTLLAQALGLTATMEYVIVTRPVHGLLPSLPPYYHVDIAHPASKTVIEVDGKTHRLAKWQRSDARKRQVLAALGWCVLRFWNEEIVTDLPRVVHMVESCMILRLPTTTTIAPIAGQ